MGAPAKRPLWRRVLRGLGVVLVLLVLGVVVAGFVMHEPRPEGGRVGPEAETHAHALLTAVDGDAWDRTGALRWNFAGRQAHLWDKARNFARVRWDDVEVLLRLHDQSGRVTVGGNAVSGDRARELREQAYAHWINDSFWLNPVVKLFDEGTTRALVRQEDGSDALLLSYASGGLTPGDEYLWIGEPSEPPRAWKMWVSILPVGGIECTWDRWQTLSTGAKVSTKHDCGLFVLELTDVAGAEDVRALEGDDPFASLE
ncbi:MAG: hypothetical protein H6720_09665 [Sandaracinus sp.]|nr:hypothetical protein [Sandaracinus sp.]